MGRKYQVGATIPVCGKVKQELGQRFVVYKAMVMLSSQRVLPSSLFLIFHCLDWPRYVTLFVFDLELWPQGFVVEGSEMFVPVREHIDLTAHGDIMLSRTLCRRRRLLVRPLPDALAMPGAVGIVVTDLQNTKAAPMQVALESSNNPSVSVVPKEGEMMHSVRVDLVDAVGNVLLSGQFDRSSGLNMIEESFLSLGGNKEGRSE